LDLEGPNPTTLNLGYLQGGQTYQIMGYFEEEDIGSWVVYLMQRPEGTDKWVALDKVSLEVIRRTTTITTTVYDFVKFRGIIIEDPHPPEIIVRIDEVLSDPEGRLSVGDLAWVDLACDPEMFPEECSNIDWPLHQGDRVEVYARHYEYEFYEYAVGVWIYGRDSPLSGYVRLIEEILEVDVYTDRGGQGPHNPDGEYYVGERVEIYCSVNVSVDRLRVKIMKPDGSQLTIYDASWAGGVFHESGTAGYPLGERRAICEVWKGDRYASDETTYWVIEETVTVTTTTTTTVYETTTSTVYKGDTTWTTVTEYVAETVYKTVESWTTTTITHYTTKTYTTTITTTITQSTGIIILCIGILAALSKIYGRWKK